MDYGKYYDLYIEFYNRVIDITKLIKDFLYPGEYNFKRLSDNMDNEEKINYIKRDLEDLYFNEQVGVYLSGLLEDYFPNEGKDLNVCYEQLSENIKIKLDDLYEKLQTKYLPFLKQMTILDFPIRDNKKHDNEEVWKRALNNPAAVETLEGKIEDIAWGYMDSQKGENTIDGFLKEAYYLNEIEFNRFIVNPKEAKKSSIAKREENPERIKCDFSYFDKYFEDIYGQDEAIQQINKVLKRNILFYNAESLQEENKEKGPLASFMFYGPTGTGKTECAKIIADFVFKNKNKLLILDMNSYKDSKVSASALKGHPEGYIDSEKGTDFTRFLSSNSEGIIVLDEFEKSSKEVRELFMTMLDEGEFKDARGNVYDLSSYIFIATTNASEQFDSKKVSIGFNSDSKEEILKRKEKDIKEGLRELFSAPIMNRFNNLIHFKKIEYDDALSITKNLINKTCNKFETKRFNGITPKIKINDIDEIAGLILKECNYQKDGVRSVKNVVNDIIGSQIIEQILEKNENILISYENNNIVVKKILVSRM